MKNTIKGNFVGFTNGDSTITNSKDTIQENIIINNKQQTALEWYAHRLYEIEISYNQGVIDTEVYAKSKTHALEQAKEMEKERMIEFGELCWKNLLRSDVIMRPRDVYNETYGGNK